MPRDTMLPSHGVAYGVFLLAHAARLKPRGNATEWIQAARAHGSYLAAATDLESPAQALIQLHLAKAQDRIELAPPLLALSHSADRTTLCAIARLVLKVDPPLWLRLAVKATNVTREYIPEDDLKALQWLEPDLDRVLIEAKAELGDPRIAALRKEVGDVAELFIMAALENSGLRPVHVARISDAYGYDIEVSGRTIERIEVKAAGPKTRGRFHLSRNEFERSEQYGSQWRLLQVVFTSSAFLAKAIGISHIEGVYELAPGTISTTVPADPPGFVWTESAILTPDSDAWRLAEIRLDPGVTLPGFGVGTP